MNIKKITNTFYPLMVFGLLNIPSIKIFYVSEIINVVIFVGLVFFGVLRSQIKSHEGSFTKRRLIFLQIFILLWTLLFANTIFKEVISIMDLIRYLSVVLFVVTVTVFTIKEDLFRVVKYQTLWGLSLAILYLTIGIDLDRSTGQHYLTLGVPIGLATVCFLGLLIFNNLTKKKKIFYLLGTILLFFVLIDLTGRSPLLFAVATPILILLYVLIFEKNFLKKFRAAFLTFVILPILVIVVYNNLPFEFKMRIQRISSDDEPRKYIFRNSIEQFKENPFGQGLNVSIQGAGYPHNIFLEILLSGGVITALVFLILILFVIKQTTRTIRMRGLITITSIAIFLFLSWNVSYDLSSGYIPFTAMALVVVAAEGTGVDEAVNQVNGREHSL